ncbi:hypothetical protein [Microbacterium suaedae]|uniref:hypothetical protein n=1 Tax=Microbacterium suaedae TaxID=2067813 RepID=UPI0013A662A2|nr:hypothetical protein [Microbacterium suaedae]
MHGNHTFALIQYEAHVREAERRIASERLARERDPHGQVGLDQAARPRRDRGSWLRTVWARTAGRMTA